ncbi:MAG: hypothetical protein KJ906_03120 [Nanoarchaeota archaeon]|nr:hypothetical protein [Nanoarchaeota archaeon]
MNNAYDQLTIKPEDFAVEATRDLCSQTQNQNVYSVSLNIDDYEAKAQREFDKILVKSEKARVQNLLLKQGEEYIDSIIRAASNYVLNLELEDTEDALLTEIISKI